MVEKDIDMEKIKVKIVATKSAKLPQYMTEGAAGMDIFANIDTSIDLQPMGRVLVPTGIKMEIPYGYEVQVRPRSGLAIKHGLTLLNTPGTIDSDYRGEIKVIMINLGEQKYTLNSGERIAQLVLKKVYKADLNLVEELSDTNRSEGGFGHTGN